MVSPIQEISAAHKKGRQKAPFPVGLEPAGLLQAKTRETFVEARDLTAAVDDAMLASPRRMAGRINLQLQRVTGGAPGGADPRRIQKILGSPGNAVQWSPPVTGLQFAIRSPSLGDRVLSP